MEKTTHFAIPSMEKLLESGVHFGHQITRWNPKMKKYIYQKRESVHIVDLAKTQSQIEKAVKFIASLPKNDHNLLFVGTKKQAKQIVKQYAQATNMPYITNRWIGGLLTNFGIVSRNIQKLNRLKVDLENKEFLDRYTKKEINEFKVEYSELLKIYEGVKELKKIPDAMFVIDAHYEKTAILEARKINIPVIALIDTNGDPTLVDYPIPGNDDSFKSIDIVCKTIADAINQLTSSKSN